MLFREVFCAAGTVSFIFLYGTRGLFVVSVVFFVLFITDLLLTIANWKQLNKHLATIHAYLNGSANQIMENFSEKIPESLISDENGIRVKSAEYQSFCRKENCAFLGHFRS